MKTSIKNAIKNNRLLKHPSLARLVLSLTASLMICIFYGLREHNPGRGDSLSSYLFAVLYFAVFVVYPFVLILTQIIRLCLALRSTEPRNTYVLFDIWGISLALIYQIMYLSFLKEVRFDANWTEQLVNQELHSPLNPGSLPTILLIFCIAVVSYLSLSLCAVNQTPPLLIVLFMAGNYLGLIFFTVWTIQIFQYRDLSDLLLILPAIFIWLSVSRIVVIQIRCYQPDPDRSSRIDRIPVLNAVNKHLASAARNWPAAALLLLLPLAALALVILLLFGQAPDAAIRAFTETSDWQLSTKTAPQNIFVDQHYLCTVAAGGHRKVVRPLRRGIRHGHPVCCNRQLLIANAFEQILEEKTPRVHRSVRRFYDHYGFPVAKLIHSKWIADLVWLLMKPLEWFFLLVLYLTDVHPEDRIAIQYTGKSLGDFANSTQD